MRMANNNGHDIDLYAALGSLTTKKHNSASAAKQNLFYKLIESLELSSIGNLEYVLRRIDVSSYTPSKEQNNFIVGKWKTIDQATAGDKLKSLVRKVLKM